MSNAVDRPVWPCSRRYGNPLLVSAAVQNPENIRIVQTFPRYIVLYGPRVNGYSPGSPRSRDGSDTGRSCAAYATLSGGTTVPGKRDRDGGDELIGAPPSRDPGPLDTATAGARARSPPS